MKVNMVKDSIGQRMLEVSSGGLLPAVGSDSLKYKRIGKNTVAPQPLVGSTLANSEQNTFPRSIMKGSLPVAPLAIRNLNALGTNFVTF